MGGWWFLFSAKEDHYADPVPRTVARAFNSWMDPFGSYSDQGILWDRDAEGVVVVRVLQPPAAGSMSVALDQGKPA